ncbi:MAG: ABC transporter ATP-binding protein [Clostridium sp.]
MSIIELKNIKKEYGKKNFKFTAIDNINLSVEKGDFIAIMGPSGAGKSTLLNIIGCMDQVTEGEYYLNGKLINELNNKELSKVRNSTISFVFQDFALMKEYNVYDNVELPLSYRNLSNKQKKQMVIKQLEALGIKDQIKKKPSELSGGQQQRVAIARALVSDGEIILADEPTGALDSKTGMEIMNILSEINKKGKTIIIVTHDEKVASYCNKKIIIKDGRII